MHVLEAKSVCILRWKRGREEPVQVIPSERTSLNPWIETSTVDF